jgi:hypothetical protein
VRRFGVLQARIRLIHLRWEPNERSVRYVIANDSRPARQSDGLTLTQDSKRTNFCMPYSYRRRKVQRQIRPLRHFAFNAFQQGSLRFRYPYYRRLTCKIQAVLPARWCSKKKSTLTCTCTIASCIIISWHHYQVCHHNGLPPCTFQCRVNVDLWTVVECSFDSIHRSRQSVAHVLVGLPARSSLTGRRWPNSVHISRFFVQFTT